MLSWHRVHFLKWFSVYAQTKTLLWYSGYRECEWIPRRRMMLVLLLCIIMKIAELSVGRMSPPPLTMPAQPPPPTCNRRCRRCIRYRSPSPKCGHRQQSYGNKYISRKCKDRELIGANAIKWKQLNIYIYFNLIWMKLIILYKNYTCRILYK